MDNNMTESIFGMKRRVERKEKYEERKKYIKEKYEKTKQVLKRPTRRKQVRKVPHTHAFGGMLYRHW